MLTLWRSVVQFCSAPLVRFPTALDTFGSREVIVGSKDARAAKEARKVWGKGYIVQRAVEHGKARIEVDEAGTDSSVQHWPHILGAYVIDGKCAGIEAKIRSEVPVSINLDAMRTAVFPTRP